MAIGRIVHVLAIWNHPGYYVIAYIMLFTYINLYLLDIR